MPFFSVVSTDCEVLWSASPAKLYNGRPEAEYPTRLPFDPLFGLVNMCVAKNIKQMASCKSETIQETFYKIH